MKYMFLLDYFLEVLLIIEYYNTRNEKKQYIVLLNEKGGLFLINPLSADVALLQRIV